MEIDVFDLAKQVPIESVIGRYVKLKQACGNYQGLCPFHNDRHLGSFVVFKHRFRCFACDEKGDGIDFVSKHLGIPPLAAAISIAEDGGMLTHAQADVLRKGSSRHSDIVIDASRRKFQLPKESQLLTPKESREHLDKVYQCFVNVAEPLNDKFRDSLLNERKIPANDLQKYFVFPKRSQQREFVGRLFKEARAVFDISDVEKQKKLFLGVPGFFLGPDGQLMFPTPMENSLGIVVYDRDGLISGIQTRAVGNVDKRFRYKFMSSGFADGLPKSFGSYGCACGYVEDVLYPKIRWNHAIAVTEGRFKAETLSKLGFLVVNLHSISNWSPAGDVALALAKKYKPREFILCYDSESNPAVTKSAGCLYKKLCQEHPVEFAVWDSKYGKGIDDVVNAGHIKKISRISPSEYFKAAS